MKILDSILWVFGMLGTHELAISLLDEIDRGETRSALSAYMVQEILDAFATPTLLSPPERDRVQTAFLERLPGMVGLIDAPTYHDVAVEVIQERRRAPETRLLARILDIQPKDVPILVLAYRYVEQRPTILTNDRTFAECVPADLNLPEIAIEYVP